MVFLKSHLMQRRETVDVGCVDIGAFFDEPTDVFFVARMTTRQKNDAIGEVHGTTHCGERRNKER